MNEQNNGQSQQGAAEPSEHQETSPPSARSSQVVEGEAAKPAAESPSPAEDADVHSGEPVQAAEQESVEEPDQDPVQPEPDSRAATDEAVRPSETVDPAPEGEGLPPFRAETPEQTPDADMPAQPRKRSVLLPVAVAGVALIGGGVYLAWDKFETFSWDEIESLRDKAQSLIVAPVDSDANKREIEDAGAPKSDAANSDAAATPPSSEQAASVADAGKGESAPAAVPADVAKSDAAAAPPAKEAVDTANPDAGKAEPAPAADAVAPKAETAPSVTPKVETPPPVPSKSTDSSKPAKAEAGPSPGERALTLQLQNTQAQLAETQMQQAETQTQLALTQAQLSQMQQRIAATEANLAAAKTETRALSAPDAAPARADDAAARLVLAQSALAALRQDADASSLLGALENLGADPQHVAQMRAGQSAPNLSQLKAEFVALSDRMVAAAAPPPPAPKPAEGAPKNLGEKALSFIQLRAQKMLKLRAAGSVEDQTAGHVAKAVKHLNAGDLSGALAEQALLPDAAREVSAGWAKAATARMNAESAAKAEVEAALQNLSKAKN